MTKRKNKTKARTNRTAMRCVDCETVQSVVLKNLHHEAGLKCWKCGSKIVRDIAKTSVLQRSDIEITIPRPIEIPVCPYCSSKAKLVSGSEIYPGRSDLLALKFYSCKRCDAYVGCHKGTELPLGTLANSELRKFRQCAHRSFDARLKDGKQDRREAYEWLAAQLGIPQDECHIGMFDLAQCKRVIDLTKFQTKRKTQSKKPIQDCVVHPLKNKLTLEDYSPAAYERQKLSQNERRYDEDKKSGKTIDREPEEFSVFDLSNEPDGS